MNEFRQHVPNFVDSKPHTFEFDTTEELLANEVVQTYIPKDKDYYFAMSDNYLMIVTHEGCRWLVVGFIKYPEQVNLPIWTGPKYVYIDSTDHYVVLTRTDILSVCGDIATLKDGTEVKLVGVLK